jgi:hypothetical protein
MSGLISNNGYIGYGKQSVKGTAVTPQIYLNFLEESFKPEFEITPLREGCNDELIKEQTKNLHKEKTGAKVYARPNITAALFSYLLGTVSVTDMTAYYLHEIIRNSANKRPWLTMERNFGGASGTTIEYKDAKIESITIEAEAGKEVSITDEGNALTSRNDATASTPSCETERPFMFWHGCGTYFVNGSQVAEIKKFSIKVTITSQEGLQGDCIELIDLPDLKMDIEVTFDLWAADLANWKKVNYNNQTTPQTDLFEGSIIIDLLYTETTSNDRGLKIEIPRISMAPLEGINLNAEPENLTETFTGIALKPDASDIIKVSVRNGVATSYLT